LTTWHMFCSFISANLGPLICIVDQYFVLVFYMIWEEKVTSVTLLHVLTCFL
jgi:hypothetical protein